MRKSDLISKVAQEARAFSCSHQDAEDAVKAVFAAIEGALANEQRVEVRGFGTFGNDPRKEYALEPYRQFGEPRIVGLTLSYSLSGENQ